MSMAIDRTAEVARVVTDLKARFFPTPSYREFQREFDLLLAERRANLAVGRQKEVHGLLILGPSGAGKTTLVRKALHQHPSGLHMLSEGEEQADVVSVAVPSPATPKGVGLSMLDTLGYQLRRDRSAHIIWQLVKTQFAERQVLFLHLDEAQDFARHNNRGDQHAVISTLKSLMQSPKWPVGLILSGMPDLLELVNLDPQLACRLRPIEHRPLCENVGTLVTAGPNSHPKALDRRRMIEAGAVGFAICAEGPEALWDVYGSIRRRSSSSKGGFYADFGFYTRWLQRMAQPERYRQVLDHFQGFVLDSYPLAPGQEVLGRSCTRRRWFTWAEIGRKDGLSSGRVARFQRALGISGDDLRRVAPGAYDTELSILSRGLDRKQAARHLNLHPSAIDKLVAAGLLNHALALPQMDKLFLPEDIDSFLTAVFANADPVDTAPAGAWSLRSIAQKATLPNADLLRAVISGRLKRS